MFIGSLALRLFALITPSDLAGHYDRVAVRRGLGTPDAPGVVEVFVVALARAWRHTAPRRGCPAPLRAYGCPARVFGTLPRFFAHPRHCAHLQAGHGPDGRACWRGAGATSALACRELHTWLWRNEGGARWSLASCPGYRRTGGCINALAGSST